MAKRRKVSDKFKAKTALEASRGDKAIQEMRQTLAVGRV